MRQNKLYTVIACMGMLLVGVSCMDNYEKLPVDQFTGEYVFSVTDSMGTQASSFLNSIYDLLPEGHNGVGGDYLDAASDDAISIKQNDPSVYQLAVGRYSANSRIYPVMEWGRYYEGIRKANIIINNIDVVPYKTTFINFNKEVKPLNYTVKAEARFLRTFFYFELVKRY